MSVETPKLKWWPLVVGVGGVVLSYWLSARKNQKNQQSEGDKKFKMIALDLDGTLLGKENSIPQGNVDMLRRIAKTTNTRMVICTGRMTACALPAVEQLDLDVYMICYNGVLVLGKGSENRPTIICRSLHPEVTNFVIDYSITKNYALNYYQGDTVLSICKNDQHRALTEGYQRLTECKYEIIENYEAFRDTSPPKLVLLAPVEELDALENDALEALSHLEGHGDGIHVVKGQFFIEFLRKDGHKGEGIKTLCEHLNIGVEEVVGFGDGNNDSEYLKTIGLGIAMKNATDLCKKKADRVSKWSHTECAVARELSDLLERGQLVY